MLAQANNLRVQDQGEKPGQDQKTRTRKPGQSAHAGATHGGISLKSCSSKRASRELQNWRAQGNPPTFSANPLPTFSANLFCQPFLPTPLQAPLSTDPRHTFRNAGQRLFGGWFPAFAVRCLRREQKTGKQHEQRQSDHRTRRETSRKRPLARQKNNEDTFRQMPHRAKIHKH